MRGFLFLFILTPVLLFGQHEDIVFPISVGISPVYQIRDLSWDNFLNETRAQKGSPHLRRSQDLDVLALERCLRMVRILEKNPVDIPRVHGKEAHTESIISENAGARVYATPYFPDRLGRPSPEEIKSLYAARVREFKEKPSGSFYDDSPGHSRNRTDPRWREFGEASVLVLLRTRKSPDDRNLWAPDTSVKMIWLNYEVFR